MKIVLRQRSLQQRYTMDFYDLGFLVGITIAILIGDWKFQALTISICLGSMLAGNILSKFKK